MKGFISVGIDSIKFWFVEAPIAMVTYFASVNNAFLKLFSFFILTRTFFKPWKNEYRKGYVGFAIFVGMSIKSVVILFDLLGLLLLIFCEMVAIIGFVAWPFVTVGILIY